MVVMCCHQTVSPCRMRRRRLLSPLNHQNPMMLVTTCVAPATNWDVSTPRLYSLYTVSHIPHHSKTSSHMSITNTTTRVWKMLSNNADHMGFNTCSAIILDLYMYEIY